MHVTPMPPRDPNKSCKIIRWVSFDLPGHLKTSWIPSSKKLSRNWNRSVNKIYQSGQTDTLPGDGSHDLALRIVQPIRAILAGVGGEKRSKLLVSSIR